MIKKKLSFHERFIVDSVYGKYKLESLDWLGRSFTLTKEERKVAIVHRKSITTTNTYTVEIDNNEDQAFVIALVLVISQVL